MGSNTFRLLDRLSARAASDRFSVRTPTDYYNRTAQWYAPIAIPCPWDSDGYEALPSGLWYVVVGGRSYGERTGLSGHIGIAWTYTVAGTSPGASINIIIGGSTVDTVTVAAGQPTQHGIWWLPDSYFSSPYLPTISTSGGGGYLSALSLNVPDGFLCSDSALGTGWVDTDDTCFARSPIRLPVDTWTLFHQQSVGLIGPAVLPNQIGAIVTATTSRAPAWSGTKPSDVVSPGGNDAAPICSSNMLWNGSAFKRFLIPNGMPFSTASGSMFGPAGATVNKWILAPRSFIVSSAFSYTVTVTVGSTTIATATGSGTTIVAISEADAITSGPLDATITLTAFSGGGSDAITWTFTNRFLPPPVCVASADGSSVVRGRRHLAWTFDPVPLVSSQSAVSGATSYTHSVDIYSRALSALFTQLPAVKFTGIARGWYYATGGSTAFTCGQSNAIISTNTGDVQPYTGNGEFVGYRLNYSAGAYTTQVVKYTPSHAALTAGATVALTQGAGWYWGEFTAGASGRYRFSVRPASIYHPCRLRVLLSVNDSDNVDQDYEIGAAPPLWSPENRRPSTRTATPPTDDWYGQRLYCVGSGATGAWAGHDGEIAIGDQLGPISSCVWWFIRPVDGMLYGTYRSVGGAWVSATEDDPQEVEIVLSAGDTVRMRACFHLGTDTVVSAVGSTGMTAERSMPWGWPNAPGVTVNCSVTAL